MRESLLFLHRAWHLRTNRNVITLTREGVAKRPTGGRSRSESLKEAEAGKHARELGIKAWPGPWAWSFEHDLVLVLV